MFIFRIFTTFNQKYIFLVSFKKKKIFSLVLKQKKKGNLIRPLFSGYFYDFPMVRRSESEEVKIKGEVR